MPTLWVVYREAAHLDNCSNEQYILGMSIALAIRVLTSESEDYPCGLRRLPTAPRIEVRGVWNCLPEAAVAVVGTRHPTRLGMALASDLSRALGEAGYGLVSGLAKGIDTACHAAALKVGAPTAAVLGCGVDVVYPKSNRLLMQQMAEQGALISEHAAGTPPLRGHFPKRNRLIAALTRAVIVVEAGPDSGALHTAEYARRLGLPVLVPLACLTGEVGGGLQGLLRQGAFAFADVPAALKILATGVARRMPLPSVGTGDGKGKSLERPGVQRSALEPSGPDARSHPGEPRILPRELAQYLERSQALSAEELFEAWHHAAESIREEGAPMRPPRSLAAWSAQLLAWEMQGEIERGRDGRFRDARRQRMLF